VLELHWTTDGERIAPASPDKSVRVWDAATGAQARLAAPRARNPCGVSLCVRLSCS